MSNQEKEKLNRIEVINHSKGGEGREYVLWRDDIEISTDLQDGGRTLKVFVRDRNPEAPEEETIEELDARLDEILTESPQPPAESEWERDFRDACHRVFDVIVKPKAVDEIIVGQFLPAIREVISQKVAEAREEYKNNHLAFNCDLCQKMGAEAERARLREKIEGMKKDETNLADMSQLDLTYERRRAYNQALEEVLSLLEE